MADLKIIRGRIKSVKSIQQVTRAMKMVAAAKLRRAQLNMQQARPYANRLKDVLNSLMPQIDRRLLPVLQIRPAVRRVLLVVVTSDRGMAGSFNANLVKAAELKIGELGREQVDLVCIGRKGRDHFTRRDYEPMATHVEFWSELGFQHAMEFGAEIVAAFVSGQVDQVLVFYHRFKNVMVQEIRQEQLLPLELEPGKPVGTSQVLFEPSMPDVVNSLVPRHLNVEVWRYLLESYASEQAARMTAMDNATQNATEVLEKLQVEFNKARQSGITREILDIVGGAEALRAAA
ncbi:MAG: ATP synthase F1 subunit gamma [Candidatus Neomarinimicrobiota bacterium]